MDLNFGAQGIYFAEYWAFIWGLYFGVCSPLVKATGFRDFLEGFCTCALTGWVNEPQGTLYGIWTQTTVKT